MTTLMETAAELRERYDLVIFDADDTLRRTTVPGQPCPRADDEWEFLPGCRELLSSLVSSEDVNVGIASNQDQVGHGLIAEATARKLLAALLEQAGARELNPESIQLCPHPAALECNCRKPAPGMLLRLIDHFGVLPERTLFIGDSPSDQEAAHRAGVNFRWAREVFSDQQLATGD